MVPFLDILLLTFGGILGVIGTTFALFSAYLVYVHRKYSHIPGPPPTRYILLVSLGIPLHICIKLDLICCRILNLCIAPLNTLPLLLPTIRVQYDILCFSFFFGHISYLKEHGKNGAYPFRVLIEW